MNLNETEFSYPLDIEVSQLDENANLKLSAYQTLFARLAETHLNHFQINVNETLRHGLAWALISMSFEIVQPIHECLILTGQTWYSGRRGPYYRRELTLSDESGATRVVGSTFSVPLEVATRNVFHKRTLPFTMPDPTPTSTIVAEPRFRPELPYQDVDTRFVRPSYIDLLGHVNNCRYGDFAIDALTPAEKSRLGDLARADFFFQSELRAGDQFTVQKAVCPEKIFISGYNNTKGDTSFHIALQFR